jgi:RNA polymerase sigma factor (sigma-70 family)
MSLQSKTDQQLIDDYVYCGDQASLEFLVHRHKRRIFGYILVVVKNKHLAEDIFQETFIKVVKGLKLGTYRDEGRFLSWVLRIAHNLMMDHYRINKRMRYQEHSKEFDIFETFHVQEQTVEEKLVIDQIHKDIRALLEYLPPEQKEIIIMRHYYNMTFVEIAEELDIGLNTVLGRMRYALKRMRKLIKKKEIVISP